MLENSLYFIGGVLVTVMLFLLFSIYGYAVWTWFTSQFRSAKAEDFLEKHFKDDL